jgi:organic hydroperoxide reductase OsmC/OhrA
MPDQTLEYDTIVEWTEARRGTAVAPGRPTVAIGAPPEFGGTNDVWSPEHLCVAAINSCIMLTFIAVAASSKVPVHSYQATATGTLEKVGGRDQVITRVVVRPHVTVGQVDRAKLDRVFMLTERNCFISNSLNATVTIEPEVTADE